MLPLPRRALSSLLSTLQDKRLRRAYEKFGTNWQEVAEFVGDGMTAAQVRTDARCYLWTVVLLFANEQTALFCQSICSNIIVAVLTHYHTLGVTSMEALPRS
jgi:hypothetical protein